MVAFWKMAGGYLLVLAVAAMAAVTVLQREPMQANALLEQLPGRSMARKQALVYDSVTLGPYGTYDPQTWYFHDAASSSPEFIYQVPEQSYLPQEQRNGALLPYDSGDVIYQNEDLSAAPEEEEPQQYEEAPWGTMDNVVFQVPVTGGK